MSKTERETQVELKQAECDKLNATLTGKGTRHRAGQTRGKAPIVITWRAFDQEKTDTLPVDIKEFAELTGITSTATLVEYLISGYNDAQYSIAGDELAEYVDSSWDAAKVTAFKSTVKGMAKLLNLSIEETANKVKAQMS